MYDGEITIDAFLADHFAEWDEAQGQIPGGFPEQDHVPLRRPDHQRLGNTEEAHKQFLKEGGKMQPRRWMCGLAGIWPAP